MERRDADRCGGMIDNFALAVTHGLMMLAAWRLLSRPDLEDDALPPPAAPERKVPRWGGKGDSPGA